MYCVYKFLTFSILLLVSYGCEKNELKRIIKVETNPVLEVTHNSAKAFGKIIDTGEGISHHGFCWAETQNPTVVSPGNEDMGVKTDTGIFSSTITGLSPGKTYYLRAYGADENETKYGNQVSFTSADLPTVSTTTISSKTETSAQSGGNVTDDGGATVTARGVCWSTSTSPTIEDSHTTDGSGTGSFTSSITGLICETTYYVRAYATNAYGTAYGSEVSFTTSQCAAGSPTVTTTTISSKTETSAQSGGNVTDDGGATVTARGVCWSTSTSPTIEDSHTTDGSGTGSFTSSITGLICETTYYVRAYATNAYGTAYGSEVSFTTSQCAAGSPTVTTTTISSITETSAQSGGNVTDDGGSSVTARGVCWSTSTSPTIEDSHTTDGSGTGSFTSSITGLICETTYYIRAYATNAYGTAYGSEVSFTTSQCAAGSPTVTTTTISSITETSAQSGGNVTDDRGATVTARGVCWSTSTSPTIDDEFTVDGTGSGSYVSSITGLASETTYYVRAYATNIAGTAYGQMESFTTTEPPAVLPTVITSIVTDITNSSALCGGNVTDDGGAAVTTRGVCWSTSTSPTINDEFTVDGTGSGSYVSSITGLASETTYYVRAYASNSVGTGYDSEVSFTTLSETETVTDKDGNVYRTVPIGAQTWMAENLKVTQYSDGTLIPLVEDSLDWNALGTDDKAYGWYDNSTSNGDVYGVLYTWSAAVNGVTGSDSNPSGVQGICPDGWHLPSDTEWKELEMFLGMSLSEADNIGDRGTDEGGKLKETGTAHWQSPNQGATNASGFTALPGGSHKDDSFNLLHYNAYFWSATEYNVSNAWWRSLSSSNETVNRDFYDKYSGFSVRCVRD